MIRDTSVSGRMSWLAVHAMVLLVLLTTLYPVLHIASVSFSDDVSVMGNRVTFYPSTSTCAPTSSSSPRR